MRTLINIAIVLFIGLVLGGLSANLTLQKSHGIGAVNTGSWSAWPFVGGAEVDPYTSAKATADGTIPLGAAEGLAFEAINDQDNATLRRKCNYEISGNTSSARLWTLSAYDTNGDLIIKDNVQVSAVFSRNIVRYPDSSFVVKVGTSPKSSNWLPIAGEGNFKLVLRLYDTPITSNSGVIDPQMPRIKLIGCEE